MLTKTDREILYFLDKHHSLTLKQISNIFYAGQYKYASRRMLILEKDNKINSIIDKDTKQKIYYSDRVLSEHDSKVFDVYSKVYEYGGNITKFIWKPRFLKGLIEADAYFEFEFLKNLYLYLIEIDYTHYTSSKKFKLYEKLYKENLLQNKCYGLFPDFIVVRPNLDDIMYNSKYFDIYYLDDKLFNFDRFVLGVNDK